MPIPDTNCNIIKAKCAGTEAFHSLHVLQDPDSTFYSLKQASNGPRAHAGCHHSTSDAIPQAHRGTCCSIKSLAPELLGEIFSASVAVSNRHGMMVNDLPPLVFLMVCRTWRRIALGSPELWNTLRLDGEREPYEIIQLWMASSGAILLDIHLNFTDMKSYHYSDHRHVSRQGVQLIAENLSRCRKLEFQGSRGLRTLFRRGTPVELKSLRSLRIDLTQDFPLTLTGPFILGDINMPSLRDLAIVCPGHLLRSPMFSNPLNNLETLEISRWHANPADAQFLKLCPSLRTLVVRVHYIPPPSAPLTAAISLPALRELHVAQMSNVNPMPFFNVIHAPALDTLGLEQIDRNGPPGFMPALLSAFPSSLTRLHLCSVSTSPENYRSLLRKFANIDTLVLEGKVAFPTIIDILTPQPSTRPYEWMCPNLAALSLICMELDGDLIRFIEARISSETWQPEERRSLARILIKDCWVHTSQEWETLQVLKDFHCDLVIEGLETLSVRT